jgi:hypothetical protein
LLAWVVGVPWFVLPVPLTVDAPDVYGGYAIHVRQAVALAAVGLALGLVDLYGGAGVEAARRRPALLRRARSLLALPAVALALVAAAGLGFLASQWAAVFDLVQLGVDRPWAPPPPVPAAAPALAILVLRALWDPGGRTPALRLLGVLAWALVAVMASQLVLVAGGPGLPLAGLGMVAAAIGWPRLVAAPRGDVAFAAGVRVLGALVAGAAAVRVAGPWAQWGGGWVLAPAAAVGAAVGAALGEALCRWAAREGGDGPARVARALGAGVVAAPLLAALWAFGSVLTTLGFLVAHLLVELLSLLPPESLARWQEPRAQPPLALAWAILLLRLGWQARSPAGVLRFGAGLAAGWSALVLGRVALLAGGWRLSLWLGGISAALVVAAAFAFAALDPARPRHRLALRVAFASAAALALPLALRYGEALIWGGDGAVGPVLAGVALAAAGAWWLPIERLVRPAPARSVVRALVLRLPLAAVALVIPTYVIVYQGIDPGGFSAVLAAVLALAVASVALRSRGLPAPPPVAVLWLLFYAGFVLTMRFKDGPSAEDCAAVVRAGEARVLIDRHGEGGDYASVHPYDALGDPRTGRVLASFKRWDKRGGFVESIDPHAPASRQRLVVRREGEGGPLWPERMEQDAATGRVLTQVIGVGNHGLWELDPSPSGLSVRRKLGLRYEPANPWIDAARRRLVLSYVPNRAGGNPLAEVFDLDTLEPLRATSTGGRKMQMADFVTGDPLSERLYVPALFDFARFAVVEIDAATMAHTRHLELFHPAIGVAVDPEARRLFVTNPIAGRLDVYSLDTWTRTQSLRTGAFPRDVAFDPARRRLWVADYGDGAVIAYRTDGAEVAETSRAHVGALLRGVGIDPSTGLAYAASGCGVFEVAP